MVQAAPRSLHMSLPNVLTYGRIAAVPALVGCLFFLKGDAARWSAFALFVAAGITDWLDGYLARVLGAAVDARAHARSHRRQAARRRRTLDARPRQHDLRRLHLGGDRHSVPRNPRLGLREFLAELNVKIHVTQLAKWKTAAQLVALAVLLAGPAADKLVPGSSQVGLLLLWVAAILTLWTGYDYLKAGVVHAMEHRS